MTESLRVPEHPLSRVAAVLVILSVLVALSALSIEARASADGVYDPASGYAWATSGVLLGSGFLAYFGRLADFLLRGQTARN